MSSTVRCTPIAMLLVARYSDLIGNRKCLVMGSLGVAVTGLVVTMVFRKSPNVALIGLCLLAMGVFSYLGPFWALASEALTRSQTAVGLATINAIAAAGGFFGPFVIGKTSAASDVIFSMIFPAACMSLAIVRCRHPLTHRNLPPPDAARTLGCGRRLRVQPGSIQAGHRIGAWPAGSVHQPIDSLSGQCRVVR